MQIDGAVALVTGANRGLGRAIAAALADGGARTVYGGARHPDAINDPGVTPLRLDVTDPATIASAAERCGDLTLLVNNAGIADTTELVRGSEHRSRALMETNYFGTMAMCRAFAPILAANGGGALVNILSIVSFVSAPGMGAFCATKAALWSATNGLRMELRQQGTQVLAVHPTFIDTDLSAGMEVPKLAPGEVASAIVDALATGREEVLLGDETRETKAALPDDLELIYPEFERQWAR